MPSALDPERGDSLETVLRRITETIQWCASRVNVADPRGCFRSKELVPHPLENGRKAVVASVAHKRYIELKRPPAQLATHLAGGRLLVYEPDISLAHGLEESETNGYVDIENTPPWDTWIAYIYEPKSNYLLSWVPAEFVDLVSAGIAVSPERNFRWLDTENYYLTGQLHRLGRPAEN